MHNANTCTRAHTRTHAHTCSNRLNDRLVYIALLFLLLHVCSDFSDGGCMWVPLPHCTPARLCGCWIKPQIIDIAQLRKGRLPSCTGHNSFVCLRQSLGVAGSTDPFALAMRLILDFLIVVGMIGVIAALAAIGVRLLQDLLLGHLCPPLP